MFLKLINFFERKSNSITNKLTFLYSLLSFITLAITTIFTYFLVHTIIIESGKQYMIDESVIISSLIKNNPNNFTLIRNEIEGVPDSLRKNKISSYYYFIRLYDKDNKIIMHTSDIPAYINHSLFPKWRLDKLDTNIIQWKSVDHRKYLLFSVPIEYKDRYIIKYMEMALDISYPFLLLTTISKYLLPILLILLFLIISLARWITKKGLCKLEMAAQDIISLNASDLKSQLLMCSWPKELLVFGNAFNKMLSRMHGIFERLIHSTSELAHELRTPINNLIIQTEVILLKKRTLTEYRNLLSENIKDYRRLSQLINSILLLAKCDNPATSIKKKFIDIKPKLQRICNKHESLYNNKKIKINVFGSGLVLAEPMLLERILTNLLDNAIQYNKYEGLIDITIDSSNNKYTGITFVDSGIGIPIEIINDVCKHYFQGNTFKQRELDTEYSFRTSSNIGLGLALSCSIMRLHNGSLHIDSEVNKWTSVTLKFPTSS